ncbi:MAG TPA: zeta toxin family protein, partial [Patescibacteria group bacterium]|nr:zeta toxin family protein [Patescibacteria group bacterium]
MPKRRSARTRNKKYNPRQPLLIVIAGGSGSGKTWLADKLIRALPRLVVRLSLDSFYLDRSHLSPARRARLNFDHPRALDWRRVEQVLHALLSGRRAPVPVYDFKTHSRAARVILVTPRPIILLEGLWPLTRQSIRRLARLSVFLRCPARLRLGRRILRDQASRGRTRSSIHQQFRESV